MEGSTAITAAMVQPIVDTIQTNVGTLLPIGISILAIMIGVSLVPRIIYKFF